VLIKIDPQPIPFLIFCNVLSVRELKNLLYHSLEPIHATMRQTGRKQLDQSLSFKEVRRSYTGCDNLEIDRSSPESDQSICETRDEAENLGKIERQNGINDFGVECVLSTMTSDSLRAKDCILPSRAYSRKPKSREISSLKPLDDCCSVISHWSNSSVVRPLFDSDSRSPSSSCSSQDLDARQPVDEQDNPWRAAKRGDLKALKRFNADGNINWAAEDDSRNIPLYYACYSGAIVDIKVVPFLLWVTQTESPVCLERCRKSAISQEVVEILNEFEQGGQSSVSTANRAAVGSVQSRGKNRRASRQTSLKAMGSGLKKVSEK
jgi:hypothetical protein